MADYSCSQNLRNASDHAEKYLRYLWIDPTVNNNPENVKLRETLKSIGICFEPFEVLDDGKNAIMGLDAKTQACLVITGIFSKILLPDIKDSEQISSIIIFCGKIEDYLDWARQYPKVILLNYFISHFIEYLD
jgi:hypothetical protein